MSQEPSTYAHTHPALTGHVLEVAGCPLHYWLGGPQGAPLVVLTHGATMDHRMFNAQVSALIGGGYRILVWDARGQGHSQPMGEQLSMPRAAQDLLAILDQVGADHAVIGGQSLGGYVAQYLYLAAPQRVQAMVIIGSTCIAFPYAWWEVTALDWSGPLFALWPWGHFTRLVARTTALHPEVRAYALEAIRQVDRRGFLTVWRGVQHAISTQGIPGHTIEVPLLMVHGEHDTAGTIRRDAPRWAAYEPQVEYHVIPGAAHNANQDNPVFFNALLLEFLSRHVPV